MSSSVHASRAAFAAVMLLPCFAPARSDAQTPTRSPERPRRAIAVDVGAGSVRDACSSRCGETNTGGTVLEANTRVVSLAEPRFSALIAGALGAIPQLTGPDAGGGRAIMGTAAGLRVRPVRHLMVDALAAVHVPFLDGDFVTGVQDATPRTRRRFEDRIGRVGTFASAQARLGVEGGAGPNGALFRVAAGAGYMSGFAEPFTSLTGGIGSRGRRVRVTAELERWWFGLPAIAVTYPATVPPSGQPAAPTTSRYRVRERATHVRLGLEVPLRQARR